MRGLLVLALLAPLVLAGCTGSNPPPAAANPCANPPATPTVAAPTAPSVHGNVSVTLNTSMGDIRLTLYGDRAPMTVSSWVNLAKAGYFDCQRFHRVIGPAKQPPNGFMDQAGDPNSKDPAKQAQWGTGGPGYTIPDEFACKDGNVSSKWTGAGRDPCSEHGGLQFRFDHAGVMAMANTGQAHSGGSQFFLTQTATSFLDGGYPIFGNTADDASTKVVVDIGNVKTDGQDHPTPDVLIIKATVGS